MILYRTASLFLRSNFAESAAKKFFSSIIHNKVVIPKSYPSDALELVDSIKMLVEKRIKPVVQQDGGDVEFLAYYHETGEVFVRLSGACVGCSQSDITLKRMIQGMLSHYIPEVTSVYNCDENDNILDGDDANGY